VISDKNVCKRKQRNKWGKESRQESWEEKEEGTDAI
jgi:hypothetical protein